MLKKRKCTGCGRMVARFCIDDWARGILLCFACVYSPERSAK